MRDIKFVTLEELKKLEEEYMLVFCGMSGDHVGYEWFCCDETQTDYYYKPEVSENAY